MQQVPQQCVSVGCPMASVAKGFALHSGTVPPKSGIALLLESPGPDEPAFLVKDLPDGLVELQRRRERYPDLDARWVNVGAPVVGRAGTLMWQWMMAPMGLHRNDVAIFNTLHCYPGKDAAGEFAYPKGGERKKSEACCADLWLRPLVAWDPTLSVVAMHPSAIQRDVVPLPMVLRAIERAKQAAARGERVLLLMGGKAAKHWLGYGENTSRWCGHWQQETDFTRRKRAERWARNREVSVTKEKRVRKLTARTALEILLLGFTQLNGGNGDLVGYQYSGEVISPTLYDAMFSLIQSKPRKTKETVSASA